MQKHETEFRLLISILEITCTLWYFIQNSTFKEDVIMERKLISFDWAIKKLLRSKANFGILEGFLSELLFTDIKIVEILEGESNKDTEDDKFNRVDIKVKDTDDQIILIEVQYSREMDYLQRILFGTAKAITEHLDQGDPYEDVAKIISINILYFDFDKGTDYIYHGTTTFEGLHNQSILELNEAQKELYKVKKVANLYPEYYLIDVKNFDDIAKDSLDEWIYFLKNAEIKDNFKAKGLKEAKEKLDILKMDAAERQNYDRFQDKLHRDASLYRSTYVIGKIEGREEGVLITAKNMKKEGIPIETISKVTGLSIDEVGKL